MRNIFSEDTELNDKVKINTVSGNTKIVSTNSTTASSGRIITYCTVTPKTRILAIRI